jgi:two-component system sensor histidine kinase KdpD
VLAYDFFFVPPHLTFAVSDAQYILTFVGLFMVGLVISTLTARSREQAEAAQRRELETAALYALSRDLAATTGLASVLQTAVTHVSETFGCDTVILLPEGGTLVPGAATDGFMVDQDKVAVATWVFQRGLPAGRGTDTLTAADARYLPLKTAQGIVGVMGVRLPGPGVLLTPQQRRLLEAFASLAALAIESARLAEAAQQTQLMHETDKLQTALLNSISHDLRTPLASITGALSSLQDDASVLDDAARQDLIDTAWEEAERLNRLVGNLLNMTRLEAGAIRLNREDCDVQDVVGVALAELTNRLGARQVRVDVSNELPAVSVDLVLIAQALVNVIDNAVKYSPPSAPIEIQARAVDTQVSIEVCDRGIGVPPDDLSRMFDKFYRVQRAENATGTGLGLSISQGIVEAHGGRIWANNRPEGGLAVTITLPTSPDKPNTQEG